MLKTCNNHWCQESFGIMDDDLAFYEKVSPIFNGKKELIPPPTQCPECRQQRRLSFRNECNLYHRKCSKTQKQIVSLYSPDKNLIVYEPTIWWSDSWDALSYGQDYCFDHLFADQIQELQTKVPRLSIFTQNCVNSDFTNQSYDNKNCYLCSAIGDSENLYYAQNATYLKDCVDVSYSQKSELLYDSIDSVDCYRSVGLDHCVQCSGSWFLYDCVNCQDCIGSIGLRNKQYHIANIPFTKEQYEEHIASLRLDRFSSLEKVKRGFLEFLLRTPHVAAWIKQSDSVTGNNIRQSKNAQNCFDIFDIEDSRYSAWIFQSKDVYDAYGMGKSQCIYESIGVENVDHIFASTVTSDSHDSCYCDLCFSCKYCFGCIGLRHKQYCILNKQYTKEEYETLVPKIIEKMKADGEWGEFFPVSMSPFGYNETVAQEYFPLTKEEVLSRGWKWHEEEEKQDQYLGPKYEIPDSILDVPDDITKQILLCEVTRKPYKIIPQELKFYREMGIPIPRKCPDQRHKERMALRNPRKLWNRQCAKCQQPIATSYSPERPEIVYCEACYLETVY
jgi:hypothetical protein